MRMDTFDREYHNLEKACEDGEITYAEMESQMRDLQAECKEQAEEAADAAYRDAMGWY